MISYICVGVRFVMCFVNKFIVVFVVDVVFLNVCCIFI